MTVEKKYLGNLENVLKKYVADRLRDKENIDTRRLFITHTMSKQNRDLVRMVKIPWVTTFGFLRKTFSAS